MKRFLKRHLFLAATIGAVFFSPPAEANMILSAYHGAAWLLVLSLIPVVAVEIVVLAFVPGLSIGNAILFGLFGNIVSTIAGIPCNAALLLALQDRGPRFLRRIAVSIMEEFEEAENTEEEEPTWVGIGAVSLLFVLFFVGSVAIEYFFAAAILHYMDKPTWMLFDGVLTANLWSYGLIAAYVFVRLFFQYLHESWNNLVYKLKDRNLDRKVRRRNRRYAERSRDFGEPSIKNLQMKARSSSIERSKPEQYFDEAAD